MALPSGSPCDRATVYDLANTLTQGHIMKARGRLAGVSARRGAVAAAHAALVAIGFAASLPASAQLYWGAEVGAALPVGIDSTRTNVGVPTNCDQWLAENTLRDGTVVPLPADQCQPRVLPAAPVAFDLGTGGFLGAAVGMNRDRLRLEAEYFYRGQGGERRPLLVPGDPKQQEFVERSESVDNVAAHNLFANAYYGLGRLGQGKLAPYVGIGVGAMRVSADYQATSIRGSRDALLALGRNPDAAGKRSLADEALSDTLFGYQLVAGVDYALDERRTVTVKARYGGAFGEFEDGDNLWRPLRGHESSVGPGGAPIHYDIAIDNLRFWAVSVGMRFGQE